MRIMKTRIFVSQNLSVDKRVTIHEGGGNEGIGKVVVGGHGGVVGLKSGSFVFLFDFELVVVARRGVLLCGHWDLDLADRDHGQAGRG